MQYPYSKTWWIDGGRIMGGQYPGTLDLLEHPQMLHSLLACGITYFVNLQQEDEQGHGRPFRDYMALAKPIAAELGRELGFQRFEITDRGVPEPALMADCLDYLDAVLQAGGVPYVHCWGGNGRTGTVIGCWLVGHGRTPIEAIDEMARGRVGRGFTFPAPENDRQRQFIMDWPASDPYLNQATSKNQTA